MFKAFSHTLKDQTPLYVFVTVLFLMGVIFGALMVNALTLEQQQDLSRYLGDFFTSFNQEDSAGLSSFWSIAVLNLKWIGLIWVLGLSVIGLPGILIIDFLKGVLIGFSVGCLVGQFTWKGMLFALVSIAPHNLVLIPVLLICSVAAVTFSLNIIRSRVMLRGHGSLAKPFFNYSGLVLMMAVLILGISSFETWVTPVLIGWVAPVLEQASTASSL
ncbi:stage II sporulation protein M [Paenibacillus tuaregi]|uniref:stage II sporulation protein M n=1 Tax=Paenibacillus tuaregi TaxID=1816681 RepID=UPI000838705D|nr:stage II sporulation protein M [Paenibacillus tuaregi]